jgi:outer membrane lipoprotein-sorting protein
MAIPARARAVFSVAIVFAAIGLCRAAAAQDPPSHAPDAFDELYTRGQRVNATLKTLTARFTETTTSALLTRPLIARGTVAVERPSHILLRYTDPDARTVLIDGNKMTMSWPSRQLSQTTDIGTTQGRIQKYFVNGSVNDLRREFDIVDRTATSDRPNTYYVSMSPKRKQIKETLARLDLWVDRGSLLMSAMKMTFTNGDTKTMTFEDVVPNAPIEPGTFSLAR